MGGWIPSDAVKAMRAQADTEARIMKTMRARMQECHERLLALEAAVQVLTARLDALDAR